MTTTSFKFQCPHCEQRLACDIDSVGREIDCPGCERPLIVPQPGMVEARPKPESGVAPTCAVRPRDWLSHIVLGVILGALAGSVISLWRSPPIFLRGDELWQGGSNLVFDWIQAICFRSVFSFWGIAGAIVGGVLARQRFLKRLARAVPGVAPQELLAAQLNFSAPSSVVLAATSLLLGILVWGWVLTQPPDAFHNEGGMVITLGVIPLTLILWIIGGPVALTLGHRGLERVRPGKDRDPQLARRGIFLSRLMLWGGIMMLFLVLRQVNW
jgi:hypothetical protein